MKLSTLATLFLLCLLANELGAQSKIDSLQQELARPLPDSTRIALSDQLLRAYLSARQFDEILVFTETMLEEYAVKDNKYALQMALIFRALILNLKGEGDEAIRLSKRGAELSFEIGDSLQAAKHLTNTGTFLQQQGKVDTALTYYLQAYPIYQSLSENSFLSRVLNNIAILYRQQEAYEKAIPIYRQSLKTRQSLGDTLGMGTIFMNMGLAYSYMEQPDTAETYLFEALRIFESVDAPSDLANCKVALGNFYYSMEQFTEARRYLEPAYVYYQNNPDSWDQTSNTFILGAISYREEDFAKAEKFFEESIAYSQAANRWGDKQELYLNLSKTKHELGKDGEAYTALLTAFEHLDSVKEERRLELVEENLARFEVLQKEKELAVNQLELERRTRQRNRLIVGLLALFWISLGLFFIYRQRILIAKQKATLQKQRIQTLQQEQRLTALNAIIEGEEKERERIAADLHDGLGGLLTSVKSHYTQFAKAPVDAALQEKTSKLIDEACNEVRQISYNMAPRALAVAGLRGAIEDLCLTIKSQELPCELEIIGLQEELVKKQAVNIYRIIQELCNNAAKHAEATSLFVQLFQKEGFLSILVEDDGKGFDHAIASQKKGLGLSSVESRVKALNGEVHWFSESGQGTSVTVRVPVESNG